LKPLLVAVALAVVALGAFDLTSAARTRCTLEGHRLRVLALDELDVLPTPQDFVLREAARWNAARPLHLRAGASLELRGEAGDPAGGRRALAVFVTVDGRVRRAAYSEGSFHAAVPPALLRPGSHAVSLEIVAGDLSGYAEPIARWPVEVGHI
jgi:hypothetical protein